MSEMRTSPARLIGVGVAAGVIGGMVMAMWMMVYSAVKAQGFWSPLNTCMASFVWRDEARMMLQQAMANPGAAMAAEPLKASHLIVGAVLHMMFSAAMGVTFTGVLYWLASTLRLTLLRDRWWYMMGGAIGGVVLYFVMVYLVLPRANELIVDMTPRLPFLIGHVMFGAVFALLAYQWLGRRAAAAETA